MSKPISKSQFNLSLQCEKAFWLYRHNKGLMQYSQSNLQVMEQGTQFGVLMQGLFPGGIDVSTEVENFSERISLTMSLLEDGSKPIYEATLTAKVDAFPLLCMVDIMVPGKNGWHIYEVKSATKVKPEYIMDAGFQQYVAKEMGINILSVNIVHVNNKYVRQGDLEINKLGTIADITAQIADAQIDFKGHLAYLKPVDAGGEPIQEIGGHCLSPYTCGFKDYCWKDVPKEDAVFDFFSAKKAFGLYDKGMATMASIPQDYPFTGKAKKRFGAFKKDTVLFDAEKVQGFLEKLEYPIYYLDFETFMSAIPPYDNSRPYQQLCFQYSLHIQYEPGGEIEHREFLAHANAGDARLPFISHLIDDMGTDGSVVAYYAPFEISCLKKIAKDFPAYASACAQIINRMVDLFVPFRNLDVYHPAMKGSASIKAVLPALIPELSYDGLEVSQGGEAMQVFGNMVAGSYTAEKEASLRKALLEYCKLDTLAMVELVGWLRDNG